MLTLFARPCNLYPTLNKWSCKASSERSEDDLPSYLINIQWINSMCSNIISMLLTTDRDSLPMATVAAQLAAIRKQQEALARKEQALKSKSHDKVLAKIVQMAKDSGLTASDIEKAFGAGKPTKSKTKTAKAPKVGKKTGKVAPKFRNPANHAETWTGRGVSPKWVAELKAAGTLNSALIAVAPVVDAPVVHVAEAPATH
jgi:DNA-binding protein H-NS